MSSTGKCDERTIFLASPRNSVGEGTRGLSRRRLRGQPGIRQAVEDLLAADDRSGDLLDDSAAAPFAPTITERTVVEKPGTQIGPYKLLEQIGEGGFGIVFMAEQLQPVRRKVALKILKPGMDTRQVIARFEAERQALALMDHPNIANVSWTPARPNRAGRTS